MNTFKQFIAFPMYASAAWLIWVVTQQAGAIGTLGVLFGLIAIAFGFWLLSHKPKGKKAKIFVVLIALLSFGFAIISLPEFSPLNAPHTQTVSHKFGETYTPKILEQALLSDQPIFVEMTAAWCITCKVNHASSLNIAETKTLFGQKNVRYLIGDWTNQDSEITQYLNSFGRNGVPIYVYYGAPNSNGERPEPKVLPQILTPGIVAEFVADN